MNNFRFNASTNMLFGKGQIEKLADLLSVYGKNVLLSYGGGSVKKTGLYDEIIKQLNGFNIIELSGIEPNPRIESVRRGVELCKENKIDVVLAVGGGSTIDCSKMVAAGAVSEIDPWELVTAPQKIESALPIVTVLTLAATGSEMNGNAVISNMSTNQKIGTFSWHCIPKASICDPTYLFTLPAIQTAAGTADIMSHVMEDYFNTETGAYISDKIAEGILKTCIKYCPIALENPENYEARANLMWSSSLAINGLTGAGKAGCAWTCHPIEHELSAYYDITHGVGLAILTPRWMKYILSEKTLSKFVDYGVNVWGIDSTLDAYDIANKSIEMTESYFASINIPMTFSEIGIEDEKHFAAMAQSAENATKNAYVSLDKDDIIEIFRMCK